MKKIKKAFVKKSVNSAAKGFSKKLKGAKTLAEIFELVKDAVYYTMGHKR
ncbi:MAG: hypothetical protein HY515_01675, partial [Candidatus Aenigmarchaeota archaeon]|nr:hypothetical protein [Candidatus Aenigmarchaeota archaeon]